MNIEEFTADKQAKMERVADLRKQVKEDKAERNELEQAYNMALVDGNDKEADKLFPKLSELKNQIERNGFKADKLQDLNKEAIKENAGKTFLHLKEIQSEYEEKAKELDEKMKPIQKEAMKLLQESDSLQNEYRTIRQQYFSLAENFKVKTINTGISRYGDLEVFKETGVQVKGYGVVAEPQAKGSRAKAESNSNSDMSISDFAKSNRLIGGE